jgi:uncharacterized protein YbbC (DUF1343 family)
MFKISALLFLLVLSPLAAKVNVGVDVFFQEHLDMSLVKGKRIGLITNHTAVNSACIATVDLFRQKNLGCKLTAIFSPEHGLHGDQYAEKYVADHSLNGIPVYSLHGKSRRPSQESLKKVDVLIFDMQDIGSRSYTYISTLFYCMEEAAKCGVKFLVLDRPNPLGNVVDGPSLEKKWRSFIGYVNVPYCHGMTVGELAHFFNQEYKIGVNLQVVEMRGWRREMTFEETGLPWIPTSPQIPEADTAFFYPTTGFIGQLSMVSIGIGYTLPFKVVGAPWIHADNFSEKLNALHLPGVLFCPFRFRPFFGKFKSETCQGVKIVITDTRNYLPVTTQYAILGVLKSLYPSQFRAAIDALKESKTALELCHKLNGSEEILRILSTESYFIWKLKERFQKDKGEFLQVRKKYLLPAYG